MAQAYDGVNRSSTSSRRGAKQDPNQPRRADGNGYRDPRDRNLVIDEVARGDWQRQPDPDTDDSSCQRDEKSFGQELKLDLTGGRARN